MTAVPLVLRMPVRATGPSDGDHLDHGLAAPVRARDRFAEPDVTPADALAGWDETYRRIGVTAEHLCQTSAHAYALAELLVAKGILTADELAATRAPILDRARMATASAGVSAELSPDVDKYSMPGAVIDCADRIHLCRAACCRLRFALSPQDVAEGVVQWEIPQPYLNRQRDDGYCVHCNPDSGGCGVYEHRPAVCREYDCREDDRIWLDFEGRVPSPELVGLFPATGQAGGPGE